MTPDGRRRATAIAYGLATHGLFAAGVGWMIVELFGGLQDGLGSGPAWARIAVDVVLVLQFPLLHSFLLSRHGAAWLRRLAPRAHAADLATTTFAAVASLQLLVAFGLWAPSGVVWWRPEGGALWAWSAAYAASWLFLLVALTQAGLSVQTGALGWTAVFRGLRPRFRPFPRTGLFGSMRHPVYLGFALTLWTGPVWTPDRLVLALGWTAYCVVGPRLKERRHLRRYGEAYAGYLERVPFCFPRRRAGATSSAADGRPAGPFLSMD